MLCVPDLRSQASELKLHFGQKQDAQWCPDSALCDFQNTEATESKLAAVCREHSEDGYLPAGAGPKIGRSLFKKGHGQKGGSYFRYLEPGPFFRKVYYPGPFFF